MKPVSEGQLLTRDEFDLIVKLRAKHRCVFCEKPAVDAHHILDRKLFSDGGYYPGNGAAVCEEHHWLCETAVYGVSYVRMTAGIKQPVLPPNFSSTLIYDKWGNLINEDGSRTYGPLKGDDGMEKALKLGRIYWLLD